MALTEGQEEKKVVQEESKGENIVLSKDDFAKLMAKVDELEKKHISTPITPSSTDGLGTFMAEFMKSQQKTSTIKGNGQFNFDSSVFEDVDSSDDLDPENYRTFVTYRSGHFIVDDLRNNRPVRVPYNVIKFDYSVSNRDRNGKEESIVHVCAYVCKSKKELEFLTKHTRYNVDFFDKVNASALKAHKSIKVIQKLEALKRYGQQDLRQMAASFPEIQFSEDLDNMRVMLAHAVVDKEDNDQKQFTQSMLNDSLMSKKEVERQ